MKKYILLTLVLCFSLIKATPQCNNLTYAGEIGINEPVQYGNVPSLLRNIEYPLGGDTTKPIEYLWLMTTDSLTASGQTWNVLYPNNGYTSTYQYQYPITNRTWFRRCARRQGCANYVAESNWLQVLAPNPILPIVIKTLNYNQYSIYWELDNPTEFSSCVLKGSYGKEWKDVEQVLYNTIDISKYNYIYYQLYFYDIDGVLTQSPILHINKSIIEDVSLMGTPYIIFNIDGRIVDKGIYNRCIHLKENQIIIFK